MNRIHRLTAALAALVALAIAPVAGYAERVPKPLADFTVFVDPPTGFVFVKLPQGWKFVGTVQVASTDLSTARIVTELMQGDDEDARRTAAAIVAQRGRPE